MTPVLTPVMPSAYLVLLLQGLIEHLRHCTVVAADVVHNVQPIQVAL